MMVFHQDKQSKQKSKEHRKTPLQPIVRKNKDCTLVITAGSLFAGGCANGKYVDPVALFSVKKKGALFNSAGLLLSFYPFMSPMQLCARLLGAAFLTDSSNISIC